MKNDTIPRILAAEYDIVLPTWGVAVFLAVAVAVALGLIVIVIVVVCRKA